MCYHCSRRLFLQGFALIFGLDCASQAFAEEFPVICAWDNFDEIRSSSKATSNNPTLDRALIAELRKIVTIIPVNPGFQYVEEKSPNAFAIKKSLIPNTEGTVFIGLKLIESLMKQEGGGIPLAGVCAHECAHIYQFSSGIYDRLAKADSGLILVEMHADFLAGYYMAKRNDVTIENVKRFMMLFIQFGNYDYGNPKYHGPPGLRSAAMEGGYRSAERGIGFRDAAIEGEAYVRQLARVL
jgi:hypothetical protein